VEARRLAIRRRRAASRRGDYNPSLELALTIAEYFRLPVEAIFSLKPMTPLSQEIFREPPAEAR
jgi:DNA-binding XRE family transcriptional regulator